MSSKGSWAEVWYVLSSQKENGGDGASSLIKMILFFVGYGLATMIDRSLMVGLISMPQCFASMVSFLHIFCLLVFAGTGILFCYLYENRRAAVHLVYRKNRRVYR